MYYINSQSSDRDLSITMTNNLFLRAAVLQFTNGPLDNGDP